MADLLISQDLQAILQRILIKGGRPIISSQWLLNEWMNESPSSCTIISWVGISTFARSPSKYNLSTGWANEPGPARVDRSKDYSVFFLKQHTIREDCLGFLCMCVARSEFQERDPAPITTTSSFVMLACCPFSFNSIISHDHLWALSQLVS